MDALSFVLSLSFFPPKESYSVVQDAEERREKGVTMNSILKFCLRVLIGFFFSRVEEANKRERNREKRKEKKRIREEEQHKHRHARERKFLTRFWSKKKCLKLHQPFLSKHQRVLTS